jgi:hypothetical protein
MKSLEFYHDNYAYRVHYSKRDESFSHEYGTHKDHSWVIMFLELHCPVLTKHEWLNIPLDHVDEKFMQKVVQKIEDATSV